LLCARSALAQSVAPAPAVSTERPAGASEDEAREAFRSGYSFTEQRRWSEALEAFQRSAALRPHPFTTYCIAQCEFELGHATRARKAFRQALVQRDVAGVVLGAEERSYALEYLADLESKILRVALVVGSGFSSLTVDGRALEGEASDGKSLYVVGTAEAGADARLSAGKYELLVDAGEHVFAAASPGGADVVSRLVLEKGNPAIVELERPAASAPAGPAALQPALPDTPEPGTPTSRIVAYSALGVGAAGLITGAVFGGLAIAKKSELDDSGDCRAVGGAIHCDPERTDDVESFHRWADAATIGFIVGGVGVVTGGAILLLSPPRTPVREQAGVRPWVGFGTAGVRGSF
jgi:hypothetical protein